MVSNWFGRVLHKQLLVALQVLVLIGERTGR